MSIWMVSVCPGKAQLSEDISNFQENWEQFHDRGDYKEAIRQARLIYSLGERTNQPELKAYALNWVGQSTLLLQGRRANLRRKLAKKAFEESLELLNLLDNQALMLDNLNRLKDIAIAEEDEENLAIANKQLEMIEAQEKAKAYNESLTDKVEMLDNEKMELEQQLATLNEEQMKTELMLAMQKNAVDSLEMVRMKEAFLLEKNSMELREQANQLILKENQLQLRENELQLQSSQRNLFLAIAGILTIIAIGLFLRFTETRKYSKTLQSKNDALQVEQQKSEELLLNILPAVVAEELKNTGVAKAQRYENATVMFTDFKNFSQTAKVLSPEKLVKALDEYFKAFDKIIAKYNIEKIKTIGDAYLCVGGLPDKENNKPEDVVRAALDIQKLLAELKSQRIDSDEPYFEARIGIHSGPLVAGVVGSMKFAYDIWGDTVNIASRMESNGEPWRVNISSTTYDLVKGHFPLEYRGIIPIKNRGEVAMYFVKA